MNGNSLPKKMSVHFFDFYKGNGKGGMKGFCTKHELSYASVKKIFNGNDEYPGISGKIRDAMQMDISEGKR